MRIVFAALLFFLLLAQTAHAQKAATPSKPGSSGKAPPAQVLRKSALITGKVLDDEDHPLPGVSVIILGKQSGIVTSDSGTFRLRVDAEKALALVFSFTGYKSEQRNFLLNEREEEQVIIRLEKGQRPPE